MNLISRLRQYIDYISMPVTQFADTAGIPRPTMSQLLSGRNKKISNELIGKIHEAFPSLNVLWLMFGQGDMLVNQNLAKTEILSPRLPATSREGEAMNAVEMTDPAESETADIVNSTQQVRNNRDGQSEVINDFDTPPSIVNQLPTESYTIFSDPYPYSQDVPKADHSSSSTIKTPLANSPKRDIPTQGDEDVIKNQKDIQQIGISTSGKPHDKTTYGPSPKRIVNIIVYYSDNSFEAFVPEHR